MDFVTMQPSARSVPKPPFSQCCKEDAEETEPGRQGISDKFNKGGTFANCWTEM